MMRKLSYKNLSVSKGRPMRMRIRSLSSVIFLALVALVTSCDEPEEKTEFEKAIVGDWKATKNYTVYTYDWEYIGDWEIYDNGTYFIEFTSNLIGGIEGPQPGNSSGNYIILSDSIMIVTSLENIDLGGNYAFIRTPDTLLAYLENSILKTGRARMTGPSEYKRFHALIEWTRQ